MFFLLGEPLELGASVFLYGFPLQLHEKKTTTRQKSKKQVDNLPPKKKHKKQKEDEPQKDLSPGVFFRTCGSVQCRRGLAQ